MDAFHVFYIVQMVPNRAKHRNCKVVSLCFNWFQYYLADILDRGVFRTLSNIYYGGLIHYSLMLLFYTPWKLKGFLMFSGGIEKQHQVVIG